MRTVGKALLAAAVTRETYGRAFGFERMLDTLGAIVGPATALWLLSVFDYHYPSLFAVTLVPRSSLRWAWRQLGLASSRA